MSWGPYYFYAFPPFSLITLCLSKDRGRPIFRSASCPLWPTQPWFPVLLQSLVDCPCFLLQPRNLLTQPHSTTPHPLGKTLKLLACQVSSKASSRETFQMQLHQLSCSPGLLTPISSTNHMSQFCSGRQSNPYDPPIGTVLDFLVALHEKGLKYSTLNTARSAISAVVLPTNNHYWHSPSGVKIHERNLQV